VKIYGLLALNSVPTCSKTFFKADRAQIKWNELGTQVLIITQTEVDNSNMSYYGETSLYLLSAAGNFDCRVSLDKEGPIHDVAWNPNSKEFGVVYGCKSQSATYLATTDGMAAVMPAKAVIFDARVRTLNDFGSAPVNTISFNPQGRLLLLAGFGNLAGKIDVIDRRTLTKLTTIEASNTSHCAWSPCGRFLMTAVLSPRLRVDNGIKIWHCSGPLMHVQPIEELYQASWRPMSVDQAPPFGQTIPPAPQPAASVLNATINGKPASAKPAGAYRPPGARGLATPSIFKREDEGGTPRVRTGAGNGSATPPRGYNRSPNPPGSAPPNGVQNGHGGRRQVPGAAPKTPPAGASAEGAQEKKRKKKDGKKTDKGGGDGSGTVTPNGGEASTRPSVDVLASSAANVSGNRAVTPPLIPGGVDQLDPVAKKVRNLNKKVSVPGYVFFCACADVIGCSSKPSKSSRRRRNEGNDWRRRSSRRWKARRISERSLRRSLVRHDELFASVPFSFLP